MDKEKFLLYVCFLGVVAIVAGTILAGKTPLGGVASDAPNYSGVTNSNVVCNTTSTQIVATSSGRLSFELTASTSLALCRSGSCTATTGLFIAAGERYQQDDGYIGAYSCTGRNALQATAGISHKQ